MPLSAEYFQALPSRDVAPNFEQYRCKYPAQTVVCFSAKTLTPLMAVTLRPQEPENRAVVVRRDPPKNAAHNKDDQYFQGLLNVDNCEFQFVVSNLTRGNLCFCITEGDSDKLCNLVNTLRPMTTYAIPCDNRTQRAMILAAIKKAETGEMTTMREAEEKTEKKDSGSLEFRFVCYGEPHKTADLFAEGATQWMVVPGFVIAAAPKLEGFGGGESYRAGLRGPSREEKSGLLETAFGGRGVQRKQKKKSAGAYLALLKDAVSAHDHPGNATSLMRVAKQADLTAEPCSFNPPQYRSLAFEPTSAAAVSLDVVQNSFAGKLAYGDKAIKETSMSLDVQLDYDKPSSKLVLVLSVWFDLRTTPLSDEQMQAYLDDVMQFHVKKNYEALLALVPKVYHSEECVVTMEPVDTVIVTCGHACLNHTAADAMKLKHRCPVCRGHIQGFVPVANVTM